MLNGCDHFLEQIYLAIESLVLFSQSEVRGIIGITTNAFKPGPIFLVFYLEEKRQRILRTYFQTAVDEIQAEQTEALTAEVNGIIKY